MIKNHVCTTDCEWCALDSKSAPFCDKHRIPVILGNYCVDEFDALTQLDNQKVKADYGKAKLSLVPSSIIWDIAAIREYGNNKYPDGGPDNWRQVDVTRYRDAAYRHFLLYIDDPHGVDEESGFPHLWHLACNVAFLCELEKDNMEYKK